MPVQVPTAKPNTADALSLATTYPARNPLMNGEEKTELSCRENTKGSQCALLCKPGLECLTTRLSSLLTAVLFSPKVISKCWSSEKNVRIPGPEGSVTS